MADRLINENAVLDAIDKRLEAQERLITSKYARAADRHILAATIATLSKVREDVAALPSEDMTESDLDRAFAAACFEETRERTS